MAALLEGAMRTIGMLQGCVRSRSDDAIHQQSIVVLKGLYRAARTLAESAVGAQTRIDIVITQACQLMLQ
jgi:hypothetical protein